MPKHNRNGARLLASASLAALASATAVAAQADTATTDSTTVRGVVVNASAPVQTAPVAPPLTATYSEGTITRQMVQDQSAGASNSVQTLLNDQPSVFAYTNGPLGVSTDINFRAFNSGQFGETYDGVALNDIFNSGVTGDGVADNQNNVLLLASNVDSVQIYRGINNPAVNSYNSLGGTINFIPRRPDAAPGVEVGASYGSFDTALAHATVNTGSIDGFRQMVSYNYGSSDGWLAHTSDVNQNLFYSGNYNPGNGNELSVVLIGNHNDGHTPFQMPTALLQQNGGFYQWPTSVAYENDHDTSLLGIVDFSAQLSPNVTFDNKFYSGYNDYRRTSYANPADSESAAQPYELPSQAETYNYWIYFPNGPTYNPKTVFGSNAAGNDYHFYGYTAWGVGYTPTITVSLPNNTLTIGGNVTTGQLRSREFWYGAYNMPTEVGYNDAWNEHDDRLFASAYIQDDIHLLDDRLSITPGVKYLFAHTQDTDSVAFFYPYGGTNGNDTGFVSPTIGANYKITDDFAVYGALGQSVKFPDITAYYNGIPGTTAATPLKPPPVTVKPEHVNDYELGVRYQHEGLSGSLSVYREDFTNTFVDAFDPTTYLTHVSNGGSSQYQGLELQLRNDFGEQPWGDVNAQLSFAYNQAKFTSTFHSDFVGGQGENTDADVLVTAGEPLADVPDVLLSADVNWSYQGWRVDLDGRYVGSQYTDNAVSGTPSTTKIPDYTVIDLNLSKTVPIRSFTGETGSVKFSLNIDNIGNEYYYNQEYTNSSKDFSGNYYQVASPGAPRSFTGSILVKF